MKTGRTLAVSVISSLLALAAPTAASASTARANITPTIPPAPTAATVMHGVLDECSAAYFDGDARLGPAQLPFFGPVGFELLGYRRTGALTPQQFLAKYYNPTANGGAGGWIYPPDNGYVIGPHGQPIEWAQTLAAGQQIDRYGSEFGSFLAPARSPYSSRSIPPQNLDGTPAAGCNYHDYKVLKPFRVDAGPVAPWFAQPGFGLQYQLDAALVPGGPTTVNVLWLVNNGYLARVS